MRSVLLLATWVAGAMLMVSVTSSLMYLEERIVNLHVELASERVAAPARSETPTALGLSSPAKWPDITTALSAAALVVLTLLSFLREQRERQSLAHRIERIERALFPDEFRPPFTD